MILCETLRGYVSSHIINADTRPMSPNLLPHYTWPALYVPHPDSTLGALHGGVKWNVIQLHTGDDQQDM